MVALSIDKVFENTQKTEYEIADLCSAQDLIYLKLFLYGHNDVYPNNIIEDKSGISFTVTDWFDNIIVDVTGWSPLGHYNRHYIVDVCGVNLQQDKCFLCKGKQSYTKAELDATFNKLYYGLKRMPYNEVIDDSDKLVYGLINGNENNDVVPSDTLRKALADSFSNNISERIFAHHKTEVFLHTHFPWP